jgi:hypothetical protein
MPRKKKETVEAVEVNLEAELALLAVEPEVLPVIEVGEMVATKEKKKAQEKIDHDVDADVESIRAEVRKKILLESIEAEERSRAEREAKAANNVFKRDFDIDELKAQIEGICVARGVACEFTSGDAGNGVSLARQNQREWVSFSQPSSIILRQINIFLTKSSPLFVDGISAQSL